MPGADDLQKMYSRVSYHAEFYDEVRDNAFVPALRHAGPFLPEGGRMLDFGCGNGAFLIAATRAGFACEGIELETTAQREAQRVSGCLVSSLDDIVASGRLFDVIHLADVLEHLPQPAAMMRKLEGLLDQGGKFFLEGPLEDNPTPVLLAAKLFARAKRLRGREMTGSFVPFHLFRITADNQRRFLEKTLNYRTEFFSVYETGWPYLSGDGQPVNLRSPGSVLRNLIGYAALALSKVTARTPLASGNRFISVVAPR